jgi:hypothetical protein
MVPSVFPQFLLATDHAGRFWQLFVIEIVGGGCVKKVFDPAGVYYSVELNI